MFDNKALQNELRFQVEWIKFRHTAAFRKLIFTFCRVALYVVGGDGTPVVRCVTISSVPRRGSGPYLGMCAYETYIVYSVD
jgi:hypothetical protein